MAKGQCPEDRKYFPTTKVAYWYFRLNGFLTMENFVLHPDRSGSQRTDADLYGVRFPCRKELEMADDTYFREKNKKPLFMLVEITRGECKLNGPWTNKDKKNVEYVLEAIGAFPPKALNRIADALYTVGFYEDEALEVRLVAVGERRNEEYVKVQPHLLQWLLSDMLQFIYQRFDHYESAKKDHSQWDQCGQNLWADFKEQNGPETFAKSILGKLT
jgi:hypothetical protein